MSSRVARRLFLSSAGVAAIAMVVATTACERRSAPPGFQGVVELEERRIAFEVPGRLQSIPVKRGTTLAAGGEIARLDDTLVRPIVDARRSEAASAEAQLALLRAGTRPEDVRALAAQLDGARSMVKQLEIRLERQRQLASRGAAGMAPVDDLEQELSRARSEVTAITQRLNAAKHGARPEEITAAQARAAAAQAAVRAEEERLGRHALTADRDSSVIDVHMKEGEMVAAGTPVVTLADTKHPYVDVFVPQGQIGAIRLGSKATVRVDSVKETIAGEVEEIGRRTEFTPRFLFSNKERPNLVVRVRVRVDDREERLHAGLPAFVTIDASPASDAKSAAREGAR